MGNEGLRKGNTRSMRTWRAGRLPRAQPRSAIGLLLRSAIFNISTSCLCTAIGQQASGAVTTLASISHSPMGISISPDGSFLLVASYVKHCILRVDARCGEVATLAGSCAHDGNTDAAGTSARFKSPAEVAVAPDGKWALVSDFYNNKIRKVDLVTKDVTTVAGHPDRNSGLEDKTGAEARFYHPHGIAISTDGSYALVVSPFANVFCTLFCWCTPAARIICCGSCGRILRPRASATFALLLVLLLLLHCCIVS